MNYKKTVLMPINVPAGDCCWDVHGVCSYLRDGYGKHLICTLYFSPLRRDKNGRVPKPEECRRLKEE